MIYSWIEYNLLCYNITKSSFFTEFNTKSSFLSHLETFNHIRLGLERQSVVIAIVSHSISMFCPVGDKDQLIDDVFSTSLDDRIKSPWMDPIQPVNEVIYRRQAFTLWWISSFTLGNKNCKRIASINRFTMIWFITHFHTI